MESGDQQRLNTAEAVTSPGASLTAHYGYIVINRRIKEQVLGVKQVCSLSKPDVGEPEWEAGGDSDSKDEVGTEEACVSSNASENDEDNDNDTYTEPPKITVGAANTATWHQQWDHTGKLQVSGDIIEMPWHSLINRLFPLPNANEEWEENDYYVPIALLLNAISLAYARRTQQTKLLGVFLNRNDTFHGDSNPDVLLLWTNRAKLGHYLDQLIAWDASKKSNVNIPLPSFNQIVSPGEVKTKGRQKSYLNMIKLYRPDLAEIFGFSGRAEGFQLWKLNPCECLCTREYRWELYDHFVEYFEVLYSQTPSKMLVPVSVPNAAQLYKFKSKETSYYVFPFIATSAPGRMTWVGLGYSISADLCVLKLSWIDMKAWDEFATYEAVHENGWLPGVARHIEAGIALDTPTRITWPEMKDAIKRRQRYIILGSVGDPLNMCESVLDFLMVMHDVLETLEMLHKTGVMHRDLSWTNILCNPRHHYQTEKKELEGEGIGKKLNLSDKSWRSLLVDFDLGLLIEKKDQRRDQRIGTPMFMATDLASSLPIRRELNACLLLPALKCIPESRYKEALRGLCRRVWDLAAREKDAFLARIEASLEGQSLIEKFEVADHYTPLPHSLHDPDLKGQSSVESLEAESIFWITTFGLVRALPRDFKPEPESGPQQAVYDGFCHIMLNHHIGESEDPGRESYKAWQLNKWTDLLHHRLKGLALMLHAMGNYFAFAWDKVPDHDLGECHGYQVMKALLVVFIKQLLKSDAIKLNTSYPRPANPKDNNERRILSSELVASSQFVSTTPDERRAAPQEDPRLAKKRRKAADDEEPSYLQEVDFEGKDRKPLLRAHKDAQRRHLNEVRKRRWYMTSVRLKGGQQGRSKGASQSLD